MEIINLESKMKIMQDFLRKIAGLIQSKNGSKFLFFNIPFEDEKTMRVFQNADTDHIFGFENSEIKSALKSTQPKKFDDLVLLYALYKFSNYPEFQKIISQTKENQTFALFKNILKKTDDVPLWREQVFAIMQKATGCSLAFADLLFKINVYKKIRRRTTMCSHFLRDLL